MRTVFKILCIIFAIGSFGQLLYGELNIIGILIAFGFGYFGWREKKPESDEVG